MMTHPPPERRHFLILAVAWTAFVTYGSLVPLNYRPVPFADALERLQHLPPPTLAVGTRADLVANLLLFIPFSFLWMGAFVCDRSRASRVAAAVLLAPIAFIAAVALEFTQISFVGRTTSQNDVIAETIGGVAGVLLWFAVGQAITDWLRTYSRQADPRSRVDWLLQTYVVGLVLFSAMPLDLTLSLTELYGKFKSGQVSLVPFAYQYSSPAGFVYQYFADIITFVPVGAWLARSRMARAWMLPVLVGIVAGALVSLGIETLQLLVLSRFTDTTDILLGTIGCAAGAWVASRESDRVLSAPAGSGVRGWLPLAGAIAGYSAFLMVGFWFPFDFTFDPAFVRGRLESFYRTPFTALYWGSEFTALTQTLLRVLLFAPLGALWGVAAARARMPAFRRLLQVLAVLYSGAVALTIELGQLLMPSRIADPTEVFLCTVGALAGLIVTGSLVSPRGAPARRPEAASPRTNRP